MPSIIKYYVKTIDFISLKTGRATMYLVFVMMFILILSFVTRNIINIFNSSHDAEFNYHKYFYPAMGFEFLLLRNHCYNTYLSY